MESITRELYRILHSRIPRVEDKNKARTFALDWLGCYGAGIRTEQGNILQNWSSKWAGTNVEQQVFLMAALSHITETDDLHRGSVTHPACVVFPTAWHLCRRLKKPLGDFLTASLHGYEAMCRIGEAVGPSHYKIFHNTATAGVFGSAAAASYLLNLDEGPFVWAMGNAGTQAAGLWQFNEDATMSKHLHAGHAAAAGLKAALLAAEGFTGPAQILEGKKGFFAGLCPDPVPDAVTSPSKGWKLAETSIKPYPSCRHTHPAIDASLSIREEMESNGIEPNQIKSVEVRTYETALRVTDNPTPESTYAAKFSLQYCVALALKHGFPGLHHFEGDLLKKTMDSALIKKINLSMNKKYDEAYPKHWGSGITVQAAGRSFRSDVTAAKGDPENPLSEEELLQKFYGLMDYGGLEKERARRLASWILEAAETELVDAPEFNSSARG